MANPDYRPRLAVDITEDQQRLLMKHIPWGSKNAIFGVVVDDLLRLCDKHGGPKVLAAFLSRRITLEEICKLELPEGG